MDAGGDRTLVAAGVGRWLAVHGAAAEARFVYKAWLDAGGDRAVVEAGVGRWLAVQDAAPEAQFVYKAWLDAAGKRAVVEAGLVRWLAVHNAALDAQFVYKAWLDAGGDRPLVAAGVGRWLARHAETADASHVYKAWLDAGGDIEYVQSYIFKWLSIHKRTWDANFVIKKIARQENLPIAVVGDMLDWCSAFGSEQETLTKFTLMMPYFSEFLIKNQVSEAFQSVSSGMKSIVPTNDFWILNAEISCEQILIKFENIHWLYSDIRNFFHTCIKHHYLFVKYAEDRQNPTGGHIIWRTYNELKAGHLDGVRDREVLTKVARWHASWPEQDRRLIQGTLRFLRRDFPMDGLWDDI